MGRIVMQMISIFIVGSGMLFMPLNLYGKVVSPTANPTSHGISFAPTASPTPQDVCPALKGNIQEYQFDSATLTKPFYFRIYTPPCFDKTKSTRYPVLYLLHGSSYNDDQWDRLGMDETADELIVKRTIAPLIIIMPRESNYNENTLTSKYGEALVNELVLWVESHYPIQPDRKYRAIGGLSRGAGWAMRIGLSHPEMFGSIGSHSLAFLDGDTYSIPTWRRKTDDNLLPRIYMDVGLKDDYKDSAKKFELRLSEYSYPHEWHLKLGSHNEDYWSSHMEDYLLWYSQSWVNLP